MSGPPQWPAQHWRIGLLLVSALAALALLVRGQLLALALVLALSLLLGDRMRTRAWLRRIARRIEQRQPLAKLEVGRGTWGQLSRAINGLMQEQHSLLHRARLQPRALPTAALEYLYDETVPDEGWEREVAVLALGTREQGVPRHERWLLLAELATAEAEHHQALLLPCASGLQLVFGAVREQQLAVSLGRALSAAQTIAERYGEVTHSRPAAGLASGVVLATLAGGLGFSVVGTPVEQALALQQLALQRGAAQLLCDERDYLRLSQGSLNPAAARQRPARSHALAEGVYGLPL
jgi:hypothetical protein